MEVVFRSPSIEMVAKLELEVWEGVEEVVELRPSIFISREA